MHQCTTIRDITATAIRRALRARALPSVRVSMARKGACPWQYWDAVRYYVTARGRVMNLADGRARRVRRTLSAARVDAAETGRFGCQVIGTFPSPRTAPELWTALVDALIARGDELYLACDAASVDAKCEW